MILPSSGVWFARNRIHEKQKHASDPVFAAYGNDGTSAVNHIAGRKAVNRTICVASCYVHITVIVTI